jgi:hypothetical protein
MTEPTIYTIDNGQTYHMDFERTKTHIKFYTHKDAKFISYNDLCKLRDRFEKITIKFKNNG